jgi:hypothetical protein
MCTRQASVAGISINSQDRTNHFQQMPSALEEFHRMQNTVPRPELLAVQDHRLFLQLGHPEPGVHHAGRLELTRHRHGRTLSPGPSR